jgi:hypothetical protein
MQLRSKGTQAAVAARSMPGREVSPARKLERRTRADADVSVDVI